MLKRMTLNLLKSREGSQNFGETMENCIFCKIAGGKIPCSKVYEDDDVLAFLDIKPAAKGHALVIPKRHYDTLIHTPIPVLDKMIEAAKKVAVSQEKML